MQQQLWAPAGHGQRSLRGQNHHPPDPSSYPSVRYGAEDFAPDGTTERVDYGRSAVNISSFANGALGEQRRHDTETIERA